MPYGGATEDLRAVERNMAMRRSRISTAASAVASQLLAGTLSPLAAAAAAVRVVPVSVVAYPLLGCCGASSSGGGGASTAGSCTSPATVPGGPIARSVYISDAIISPHPRFGALTANSRRRRGRKMPILVPALVDGAAAATSAAAAAGARASPQSPPPSSAHPMDAVSTTATRRLAELLADAAAADAAAACAAAGGADCPPPPPPSVVRDERCDADVGPATLSVANTIHMDAMAFGMGCCCLQVRREGCGRC